MKKLIVVNVAIILSLLMNSCATSNDVVSNRLISKRKYTKGLFVKKNLKLKSDGVEESKNYAMKTEERGSESSNLDLSTRQVHTINSEAQPVIIASSSDNIEIFSDETSSSRSYMNTVEESSQSTTESSRANLTKSEQKKEFKQQLKAKKRVDTGDPVMLILLIILAIILPPVAVGIYRGIDNIFWLDLILFLIGFGGFWFLPIAGLAALAAVIIAFLVIFDVI